MNDQLKGARQKTRILSRSLRKGGGWGGGDPPPLKSASFFLKQNIKCLKCSETKEYAKIFNDIFARVSDKIFSKSFLKMLK